MALQTAASAKSNSESNPIDYSATFNSLVGVLINTDITAQSSIGKYISSINFTRRNSGDLTEIKQSDDTYILLVNVIKALEQKGYRTSTTKLNGVRLKLNLTWG